MAADVSMARLLRHPVSYRGPGPKTVGVLLVGYGLLRLAAFVMAIGGLSAADLESMDPRVLLASGRRAETRLGSIRLIHFTADGTPLAMRRSSLSRFGGYADATKDVLRAKAIPPWDRASRARRALALLLALLFAAAAIAFREEIWSAVTNIGVDRSVIPF